MNRLGNSLWLGLLVGIIASVIPLFILDAVFYAIRINIGSQVIKADAIFLICLVPSLLMARKFFKRQEKTELAKGFILCTCLWGALYAYIFHFNNTNSIFFPS